MQVACPGDDDRTNLDAGDSCGHTTNCPPPSISAQTASQIGLMSDADGNLRGMSHSPDSNSSHRMPVRPAGSRLRVGFPPNSHLQHPPPLFRGLRGRAESGSGSPRGLQPAAQLRDGRRPTSLKARSASCRRLIRDEPPSAAPRSQIFTLRSSPETVEPQSAQFQSVTPGWRGSARPPGRFVRTVQPMSRSGSIPRQSKIVAQTSAGRTGPSTGQAACLSELP